MPEFLLSPKLLRQLERLALASRNRSPASARGERRSRGRGDSIEFADHRAYVPGDDLRHLDWNIYGRLDRLFIKLHEEERELPVQVLLDASESMSLGSPPKFDLAVRLAAAIGYIGLCGFDRVDVRVLPEPGRRPGTDASSRERPAQWQALRGRQAARNLLQNFAELRAGGAARLNEVLKRAAIEIRRPGVVVVLSDFLDADGYREGLDALVARRFQISVIQILSPDEWEPGVSGDLRVVDVETGASEDVTFGRYRMKAYRAVVEGYVHSLRQYCLSRGIRFIGVRSDASVERLLLKDFRAQRLVE